jgi:gamma-glutamyltranspeptidase / glutathione hydrolase
MKGAIAAGHPLTAEAGARVLAEGGNAVDACVAAAFASWVTESPLTGPGAGGFMLVHRAGDRSTRLLDFFVAAPGRGLRDGERREMEAVNVAFADGALQTFRIGAAACAVPGAVAGLAEAHRLYGRLPWAVLGAPAAELARAGVELGPAQALLHRVLDPILRSGEEGRRIYGADRAPGVGARISMDDLAGTLELLAEGGPDIFYRGGLARQISAHVLERGGRLTEEDLATYRVVRRRPVQAAFRGHEFVSNPPPSSGGVLIALALRALDRLGPSPPRESAEGTARLAELFGETARARDRAFSRALDRGGLAARLLAEETVAALAARVATGASRHVSEPTALPSTTHISVADAEGNAVSMSASTGSGSGVVVPGTGVHLNNMLGEEDLNPHGVEARPGRRLTSMMAPSVVLRRGRPRLVVGSAGSERLRAAILQIVLNVVDHGLAVGEAIAAPRLHLDGSRLHLEGGFPAATADELETLGYEVVRWRELNLYFGGAACVLVDDTGELSAAGDPRRGGTGIVVE